MELSTQGAIFKFGAKNEGYKTNNFQKFGYAQKG